MKRTSNAAALAVLLITTGFTTRHIEGFTAAAMPYTVPTIVAPPANSYSSLYDAWSLQRTGLSRGAFLQAFKGFNSLRSKGALRSNIIAIADFSQPSTHKRLYIINSQTGELLYQSLVAHGQNSGGLYATRFSNEADSHQSSLGFYITQQTYQGEHGYSLRLMGCEKGINDMAASRSIVLHSAAYASATHIANTGMLGRSHGCPAVPEKDHKQIIDLIKNGICFFIYHPTSTYKKKSKILNR